VVHAAICEAAGELRGGDQIRGGGVEKLAQKRLEHRHGLIGTPSTGSAF
jgi:hypothetical protein